MQVSKSTKTLKAHHPEDCCSADPALCSDDINTSPPSQVPALADNTAAHDSDVSGAALLLNTLRPSTEILSSAGLILTRTHTMFANCPSQAEHQWKCELQVIRGSFPFVC